MRIGLLVATAILSVPTLALAWTQSALFDVTVHKHLFERVAVDSQDCALRTQISFSAPAEAYKSGNYYRFKARIRLDAGHEVTTRVFGNSGAGARTYSFSYDTSAEGCWAKVDHKFKGFDVEGCRGRGCTPDAFREP
jgi:hypothetical protein